MFNSTTQLANQLPVFKSQNYSELKDYQDFLKLIQKFHIQKFMLKSKEQLYHYLSNQCQIQNYNSQSDSDGDSSYENQGSGQQTEDLSRNKIRNKSQKMQAKQQDILEKQYPQIQNEEINLQNQSFEIKKSDHHKKEQNVKRSKENTKNNEILEKLKSIPLIQDFDDEDIRQMVNDFQQEDKKQSKQSKNSQIGKDTMMRDDYQYKWPQCRIRILQALTILIEKKVPVPKILQDFKILQKTYIYSLYLKDCDDLANQLWQKVGENVSADDQIKYYRTNYNTDQLELIYEMVKLVYEKREQHREQIIATCSGIIFQKKLRQLKDKLTAKAKCADKKCELIIAFLERINNYVLTGPIMNKYQHGGCSEAQLLHQKIIKKAAKTLLFSAVQLDVPVPEVLQYLSLRKSRYNVQDRPEEQGIYILPSVELVKLIVDKQGMETIAQQLKMNDFDYLDFKGLDQLNFEHSNKNIEDRDETVLYSVLQLVLDRIDELDQLSFVINDRKFKALQSKLNELYKDEVFGEPNQQQDIPQYVGSVMNKVESYIKQSKSSERSKAKLCCIKTKFFDSEIIVKSNNEDLTIEQLEFCKQLFILFLSEISSKDIAFPEILRYFKFVDGKLFFDFNQKLIGIMLLCKAIRQYFISCMEMENEFEKQITDDNKIIINSVPLLKLIIRDEFLLEAPEIFAKQISILCHHKEDLILDIRELFKYQPICEMIKLQVIDDEYEDAILDLKCLYKFITEQNSYPE
ncbi:unnamed protein product (macronuclear) [Paramecium tetraurelia]|uniref:Uncharacterized protein n=1 Tax=Paramecium tetraurelia TaxID=5888 RepID=A0CMH0_PARTE|nr:uncharacterized protein GSPATT00008466001 [Paramecium tetraurelia]CAK71987.1 unnamed protein product [Paramecium tetraurelia]|eukprot:XP_001439384.1 hypothetical protein (macronuclear) [Paramecium tetraurelia strain d4-2]